MAGGSGVIGQAGAGGCGVIGLASTAVRNPTTELANPAGVFGLGDATGVGVRGEAIGPNIGVIGSSKDSPGGVGAGPGVRGVSDGIGVNGEGDTGVFGHGTYMVHRAGKALWKLE
jgi:hypothetical protein